MKRIDFLRALGLAPLLKFLDVRATPTEDTKITELKAVNKQHDLSQFAENDTVLILKGEEIIACTNNATLTIERHQLEVRFRYKPNEFVPGASSWSVQIQGLLNFAPNYSIDDLTQSYLNQEEFVVMISRKDQEKTYFKGECILVSLSATASLDRNVTYELDLSGTGPITLCSHETD